MVQHQIRAMGVAWYRREDWSRIKAVMVDANKLADTFDDWLRSAEQVLKQAKAQGVIAEKVTIDPRIFPDWCKANDHDIDAKGRMAFCNEFVAKKYGNTH